MSFVHWRVFGAVFVWGLGDGLWLFVLPLYVADLGATPAQIGWVLSLSIIGAALLFIPAGIWIDRHRRKPVFVAGYSLATIAVAGMAFAPTWQTLLPGLALYNLTILSRPALHSYLTSYCIDPGHEGRCFGRTFSGYPLGALLTPALGAYLGQATGLRDVFLLAVIFYFVSIILLLRLPGDRQIVARETRPAFDNATRAGASHSVGTVVFFFAFFLALNLGQPLAANYLSSDRGVSLQWIGVMGSVTALGTVVLNWLCGLLPEEPPWALLAVVAAVAAGLFLLLAASNLPFLLVGCFFLAGASTGAVISSGFLRRRTRPEHLGEAFGQRDMALYLAIAASSWLAGQLYQQDPALPLRIGLLALTVMAAILLLLYRQAARPAAPCPSTKDSSLLVSFTVPEGFCVQPAEFIRRAVVILRMAVRKNPYLTTGSGGDRIR
ncbi:MAG: MFS transporter [Chloroflexi bacterium]|nr:MFS transporter [Chloroflexota bacterium]